MIRKFQKEDTGQVMRIWLNGNKDAHPFIPKEYWESNYSMVENRFFRQRFSYMRRMEKSRALSELWGDILREFLWTERTVPWEQEESF